MKSITAPVRWSSISATQATAWYKRTTIVAEAEYEVQTLLRYRLDLTPAGWVLSDPGGAVVATLPDGPTAPTAEAAAHIVAVGDTTSPLRVIRL